MSINIENFKPKSENHILNKMWDNEYGLEFQEVIKSFTVFLNTNKKLKKLKDKLFLKQNVQEKFILKKTMIKMSGQQKESQIQLQLLQDQAQQN